MEVQTQRQRGDSQSTLLDRICEELLTEILKRLPIKAVHRCKSVSKRWCNLISTNHFAKCYVRHQKSLETLPPFCLFCQRSQHYSTASRHCNLDNNLIFLLYASTNKKLFQSPGFSLLRTSSSPTKTAMQPRKKRRTERSLFTSPPPPHSVLASSNGLVLCSNDHIFQSRYYVCNPLTKCWVSIPPPPTAGLKWAYIGFLCKTMDFENNSGSNNSCAGFVIFRIPNHGEELKLSIFKLEIYNSENGQWAESELDNGWRHDFERFMFFYFTTRNRLTAVVCKGLLHWGSKRRVFVYDSSIYTTTTNNKYRVVRLPPQDFPTNDGQYLGECKGQLMFTLFRHRIFTVWNLKDYGNGGEWGLLHNITLDQMVFDQPSVLQFFRGERIPFTFLAIHPFDKDIIFIYISARVLSCNMRENTVTYIGSEAYLSIFHSMPYLVVLPWWPVLLSLP